MDRVLTVGPVPPPFGGVASVMDDIVHSKLREEYVIDVFERIPWERFPPGSQTKPGRNLFRLKRFIRFFKTLREGNYDILHIHSADTTEFLGTTIFMALALLAGVKVLLHIQGCDWDRFYTNTPPFRKLYTRIGLYLPDRTVVLYGTWVTKIKEMYPRANVRVVRNLLHRQDPPDPEATRKTAESLGLTEEDFVVVSVGSLGWRKGSFEILKAVPLVVPQEDSVRFVLVGGEAKPGEMAQLMDVVEKQNLGKWVRFTGEVDRDSVPLYLSIGDVFVLPSFIEGMPVAIIEAMRAGLPVISTRVQGIPDMMEHGVSGILIDPGNPRQIAEHVLRFKRDETWRHGIAEGGKKNFEEWFEFSRGIEEIRKIYFTIRNAD